MPLLQRRLGIEKIKLAWRAGHEKENYILGFRTKMRRFDRERILGCLGFGRPTLRGQQVGERHGSDSTGAIAQKSAAAFDAYQILKIHISFSCQEFIQVEQDPADPNPGGGFRLICRAKWEE